MDPIAIVSDIHGNLADTEHELRAESISLAYDKRVVVDGLSLTVSSEKVTVIVGPNASGKSTLLRGLARLMSPSAGRVVLDGRDIHSMPTREVATIIGLLPQNPVAPDGVTVGELVGRGRYPHQGWFRPWTVGDDAIVAEALAATSTTELVERPVDALSGGQRQRVWIAMALAQQTDVLLLDEPTTFLDVTHQLEVLDLLTELNRTRGTTVVMVLHDLNMAARYADQLIVMSGGAIVAQGAPVDVLSVEIVRAAFGLDSMVTSDPVTGTPMVNPIGIYRAP